MKSLVRWFTCNAVAANLLMAAILCAGTYAILFQIPIETFPEFELDQIEVRVPYRGSTPAEVEEGVLLRIEEAIQDLEGIRELRSTANEGSGTVIVEVARGYRPREVLDDVKNRIDTISTFPEETEKPVVRVAQRTSSVLTVVVSGDLTERMLRQAAEHVRDDLLGLPDITQASLEGVRNFEIAIEISEQTLRAYGLTLDDVAQAVRASSLDLPAGGIRTSGGEVLVRTKGQAYVREEFAAIPVISREDGTRLTVGDLGTVVDGFVEDEVVSTFNGRRCAFVRVQRVGDQNAIAISESVRAYVAAASSRFPEGVVLDYWQDRSRVVRGRLTTLLQSATFGAGMILLILTLFLRPALAFWVCAGIPVAFMGGIALMPALGITFNIVSLFAFILVLGIVVDDAIVTGESIYEQFKKTPDRTEAAIIGTERVAVPVSFGVLTTIVAFVPLFLLPGFRGKIFFSIPTIVIPVLLFSLIESKLILPAHLKHMKRLDGDDHSPGRLERLRQAVSGGLEHFAARWFAPFLERCLRSRYVSLAIFVGLAALTWGMIKGGRIRFVPFPPVPGESITARLAMPLGTPFEVTWGHVERIRLAAEKLREELVDPATGESIVEDILATTGSSGSHTGEVVVEIMPPEERESDITSMEVSRLWREAIGPVAGARELAIQARIFGNRSAIEVGLRGVEFDELKRASRRVQERLAGYEGLYDINDSFEDGKPELRLDIRPEAAQLGLTRSDLARQVRSAFYGLEAQRIQRGRDDVRVMVRYPQAERISLDNLETMKIRAPDGTEVPFEVVADVTPGRSFSAIRRIDRQRTINVTADADPLATDVAAIKADLVEWLRSDEFRREFPRITPGFEGESRDEEESSRSLLWGSVFVLLAVYAFLAIPFGSYVQPLIVMSVIPFGLIGAVVGHVIMGMPLSLLSLFGVLALAGIVVNDSLVLVDFVNQERRDHPDVPLETIVRRSGQARFRPILLTSLTTFAGCVPLIFEKSTQVQFVIPMAVSLGFGVLFATAVTLVLVPVNYFILEDLHRLVAGRRERGHRSGAGPAGRLVDGRAEA